MNKQDLDALGVGAAILGSGGGGAPSYNKRLTEYCFSTYGIPKLILPSQLTEEDFVLPVAFMGAPLVALEKLPTGREFRAIVEGLEKKCGRKITALVAAEIGGANAFTPLWAGSILGLPVVDGDLIGRAFPELQMNSCYLHGLSCTPAGLADAAGNFFAIHARDAKELEHIAREETVRCGSRAAIALAPLSGHVAKRVIVPETMSRASRLGRARAQALMEGGCPAEAVIRAGKGALLGEGIITDVNHEIRGGFLEGSVRLEGEETIEILYQNEFLLARSTKGIVARTPHLITLLDEEFAEPITTADLSFGLSVKVITLPSPAIWETERGLELVGPKYFGIGEEK